LFISIIHVFSLELSAYS
ncbi:unnamed protein product, partial [Rotaria magnacalcarata]